MLQCRYQRGRLILPLPPFWLVSFRQNRNTFDKRNSCGNTDSDNRSGNCAHPGCLSTTPSRLAFTRRSCSTVWRAALTCVFPGWTTRMTPSTTGASTDASVTANVGGVSITITSDCSCAICKMACMRCEPNNSAGLGGNWPVVISESLSMRVNWLEPLSLSVGWKTTGSFPGGCLDQSGGAAWDGANRNPSG